jgi:hypothetical protein
MNALHVSPLLRFALMLDAGATLATGGAMLVFAEPLHALLNLPAALMTGAGVFMLGYALVVALLSRRATLPRWAVWTIIIGNALWAIDCVALAFIGIYAPTALGIAFLLAQAAAVAGFAELQFVGLNRSTPAVA